MSVRRSNIVLKPAARCDVRSILLYSGEQWGAVQRDAYRKALDQAFTTLSVNPFINRDALAMHLKLDELIHAMEAADDMLIRAEDETVEELSALKQKYEALSRQHDALASHRKIIPVMVLGTNGARVQSIAEIPSDEQTQER